MKRCLKHPKYRPRKLPTTECLECLALFLTVKGKRAPVLPTLVESHSGYDRKKEKKVDEGAD